MHLVLLTRGIKESVDRFIHDLETRFLPFNYYDKNLQKLVPTHLQMRVSPIQLWDISFPKQHRDIVLNTCLAGNNGTPNHNKFKKFQWMLQKAMGLKAIGDYNKNNKLMMREPEHIELIGVGEKEDKWITEKGEQVDEKDKTPFSYEGI